MKPRYIVVHTAAWDGPGLDAETVDRWHKERGWDGIGYHFFITDGTHSTYSDGTVLKGRELHRQGAHTLGLNRSSIGICLAGHGDHRDFTEPQKVALANLMAELCGRYDIPVHKIIGHRDINELIDRGVVSDGYRTDKTCPGSKVNMTDIRARVDLVMRGGDRPRPPSKPLAVDSDDRLKTAIKLVNRHVNRVPGAKDSWRTFLTHPEVQAVLEKD